MIQLDNNFLQYRDHKLICLPQSMWLQHMELVLIHLLYSSCLRDMVNKLLGGWLSMTQLNKRLALVILQGSNYQRDN